MEKTATAITTKPETIEAKERYELIKKLQKYDPNNPQNNGPEFEFLWSEFYRIYKKRIYSVILRMVHNPDDAEEITQVVMLQLVRKIKTFQGKSSFTTWLHRLSVNQALMELRAFKTKRSKETSYEEASFDALRIGRHHRFGYQQYNLDTECLTLKQVIPKLPPGYLKVLLLHDLEGYEHEEVGAFLGITAGASKSQLHKARTNLIHRLKAKARRKPNLAYT